jgi:hypothetical protein
MTRRSHLGRLKGNQPVGYAGAMPAYARFTQAALRQHLVDQGVL